MEINVTPRFIKSYKKLHKEIQEKAKVKEAVFRKNPFDKRLKTHKLSGKKRKHGHSGSIILTGWVSFLNPTYKAMQREKGFSNNFEKDIKRGRYKP